MTAEITVMKWAAFGPAPTPSSSAPVVAASQTIGHAMVTMIVEITVMRIQPAEVDQHVRKPALHFKMHYRLLQMTFINE